MSLYANKTIGILQPGSSLLNIGSQEPGEGPPGGTSYPVRQEVKQPLQDREPLHFSPDNEQLFSQEC